MRKLIKMIGAGIVVVLAGCQTSPNSVGPMFNPFPAAPNSPAYQTSLAQSVQDALMRTGDPVLTQVHVSSNQNTIILTGYVKKIRQSDTAEQIARQVPGVQNVENRLIVRQ